MLIKQNFGREISVYDEHDWQKQTAGRLARILSFVITKKKVLWSLYVLVLELLGFPLITDCTVMHE